MTKPLPLACVLMASGFSRRFGGNKLLARYQGKPLYAWAMETIPPGVFAQVVVVARDAEVLLAAQARGFLALSRPEATERISGTIRLGLETVLGAGSAIAGCCFMVCDQPLLSRESVAALAAAFREEPACIWALGYEQKKGNPVIFPAALFEELYNLEATQSGSAVIRRHGNLLRLWEVRHARELLDVDTLEDLQGLGR